jgi:hypothetical protein
MDPIKVIECGCCSGWHRVEFNGDCRQDDERFASPEQAANRLKNPVVVAYQDEETDEISVSSEIVQPGSDDV